MFFDTLTLVLSSVPGKILPPMMGTIGKACIQREYELFPANEIGQVPVWFRLFNQESSSSLKLRVLSSDFPGQLWSSGFHTPPAVIAHRLGL